MALNVQKFVRLFNQELARRRNVLSVNEIKSRFDVGAGKLALVLDVQGADGAQFADMTINPSFPLPLMDFTVPADVFQGDVNERKLALGRFWAGFLQHVTGQVCLFVANNDDAFATVVERTVGNKDDFKFLLDVCVNMRVRIGTFTGEIERVVNLWQLFDENQLRRLWDACFEMALVTSK